MKRENVVFLTMSLATVALVGVVSLVGSYPILSRTDSGVESYTINGLTCPIPEDYFPYASVTHLLPLVVANSHFQNLTNGMPFVFGNAENIGSGIRQIDNQPPVHLPPALEMVFYSTGKNTTCGTTGTYYIIFVQVPFQNGGYNLTGTYYDTGSP